MKKILLLLALTSTITFLSCSKSNNPAPNNSSSNQGGGNGGGNGGGGNGGGNQPPANATIIITNNSSNPYEIYINSTDIGALNGGYYITESLTPGYYEIKVVQNSGYVFYPTVKEYDITATSGNTYNIVFP